MRPSCEEVCGGRIATDRQLSPPLLRGDVKSAFPLSRLRSVSFLLADMGEGSERQALQLPGLMARSAPIGNLTSCFCVDACL